MGLSLVQRIGPVDPAKTDFRHRLLVRRPTILKLFALHP